MNVYLKDHQTYQLTIKETLDYKYILTFARKVQNGNGNILDTFSSKENAIKAAEQFPEMYIIAQEKGYILSGTEFVNKDIRLHISHALDLDTNPTYFASLL